MEKETLSITGEIRPFNGEIDEREGFCLIYIPLDKKGNCKAIAFEQSAVVGGLTPKTDNYGKYVSLKIEVFKNADCYLKTGANFGDTMSFEDAINAEETYATYTPGGHGG